MPRETPEPNTMHVEALKARLARADYVVDPSAVAEAMLRRYGLARDLEPKAPTVRRRAHSPREGGPAPRRRG